MSIVYKRKLIPIRFAISNAKRPDVWEHLVELSPALRGHNDDMRSVGHAVRRAFTNLIHKSLGTSVCFGCVSVPDQHGIAMRVWGILEEATGLLMFPEISTSDFMSQRRPPNADHVARFCGSWLWAESVVLTGTQKGDIGDASWPKDWSGSASHH